MILKKYFKDKNIIIVFLFCFIFFILYAIKFKINLDSLTSNQYIYDNIYVNNINISGLNKEQAFEKLKLEINFNSGLKLIDDTENYKFSLDEIGISYDYEKAINEAYQIGRKESKLNNYKTIKSLKNNPIYIKMDRYFNSEKLKQILNNLENNFYKQPINATIKKESGKFIVEKEVYGERLDFNTIFNNAISILENNDYAEIYLSKEVITPEYTEESFVNFGDTLGTYYTSFTRTNSNRGRIGNIEIASSKINGTILYPNEVFSTYEKLGETTPQNGYMLAPTIVNGDLVDDYGGGICQVSSTLYNAVLFSELEVVQRQNHSLKVSYLDYGFDATIAGNYIDFKFKNSTGNPIYIESYVEDSKIFCTIYGIETRPKNRSIKFEKTLIQTIEPEEPELKYTDSLYEGVVKVKVKELKGYKYKLYKLIYEDNKLKEKKLINNSYYKPRKAQILIGTKKKT